MSNEPELKARDKVVLRMTREGAIEENLTAGTEQRVSKRLEDAELVKPGETAEPSEALSAEEQKKAQMQSVRKLTKPSQRQFPKQLWTHFVLLLTFPQKKGMHLLQKIYLLRLQKSLPILILLPELYRHFLI